MNYWSFSVSDSVTLEMSYDVIKPGFVLMPRFRLHNESGLHLLTTLDLDDNWTGRERPVGRYRSRCVIPANLFTTGRISVSATMVTRIPDKVQFRADGAVSFSMIDSMGENTARGDWPGRFEGVIRPRFTWQTDYQPDDKFIVELDELAH